MTSLVFVSLNPPNVFRKGRNDKSKLRELTSEASGMES